MNEQVKDCGWRSAAALPADPRPPLKVDLDVDVCVIGGGVAGLSAALEAARRGASVVLIEAKRIGWNASGAGLGIVAPGFGDHEADLVARLGRDHARALWRLTEEGVARIRDIADDIGGLERVDGLLEPSIADRDAALQRRMDIRADIFGCEMHVWPAEQVRARLQSRRYFHGFHQPQAFHLHALSYVRGLAQLARQAGVQIFEQTVVTSLDASGIRKRIATAEGRLRANALVLAGNVHLGALFPKLVKTLTPVWRFAAVTAPLGPRLAEAVSFKGAVREAQGGRQFRIVAGDRLLWAGGLRTRPVDPQSMRRRIRSQITQTFPQLGEVALADIWHGATGETVHQMPQIGQMNPGLWIASGFAGQGFAAAAMAGQLIAGGILAADDRWRLFAPYELVWAGGRAGRWARQAAEAFTQARTEAAGGIARRRENRRSRSGPSPKGPGSAAPAALTAPLAKS